MEKGYVQSVFFACNFKRAQYDFILSTEHGPKGGDEINKIILGKNYGWPISSYGESYANDDLKYHKSHIENKFEEPIFSFVPSIGISEIVPLDTNEKEFLVGAMGNEIAEQDLGLHLN